MSTSTSRFKRFVRSRKTQAAILLVVIVLGVICYGRYRSAAANAERGRRFVARFRASFNSGLAELRGDPEIEVVQRFLMPELGPATFRAPEVNEYVVTARFVESGSEKWGRWLYTCNGKHADGIYKFSWSTASKRDALPEFPIPLQTYIPWTMDLVDGIPATAGPSASNVSVSSPVKVTDPLIVTATAPPGTQCRVEVFPANTLLSQPKPMQPKPNGSVKWVLNLNPNTAGSRLLILVHCADMRGTRTLENSTRASANVIP